MTMSKMFWQGFISCFLKIVSLALIFASYFLGSQFVLAALLVGLFVFGANCMMMGATLQRLKRK